MQAQALQQASRPSLRCSASQQQPQRAAPASPPQRRRQLLSALGAAAVSVLAARPAAAGLSIESIDLPQMEVPSQIVELKARNQAVIDEADASFQNSDLLRTLKERSEANRGARKKELEDRYCRRQAELGVGDCGGLRLIPGMTKSGVQKRPEWMNNLFGMEAQE